MIRNTSSFLSIFGLIVFALSACSSDHQSKLDQANHNTTSNSAKPESGVKLRDVAGQATLPISSETTSDVKALSEVGQTHAGRYHVQMNCRDPFARCSDGNAEFILNLLPDGTAYRTFVYFGRVSNDISGAESPVVSDYNHQDTWEYDAQTKQIIVHRAEGVKFYYNVKDNDTIQMNLDKVLKSSPENIAFFTAGHPAPKHNYTLIKYDDR